MKRKLTIVAVVALLATVLSPMGSTAFAEATTTGTWTLYPPQATLYTTAVQQPINADGSSNFKSNGNSVIPVKFELLTGPGPVVFESILSDSDPNTDYSYLSFAPSPSLTFNQITNLQASYAFTLGDCHGGALRWSVRVDLGNDGDPSNDGSVFIYYGDLPNFTDCTANNQSGVNMIGQPDLRYDTSQVGGTFYDSYANAQALVGSLPVVRTSLVLDGGWAGDQVVNLAGATVNDSTFTPLSGPPTPTCDLPPATIQVTKLSGASSGPVDEPVSIQPPDSDSQFRIVDCKYMYNLATSSLSGPGTYQVEVVIGGNPAAGPAIFELR